MVVMQVGTENAFIQAIIRHLSNKRRYSDDLATASPANGRLVSNTLSWFINHLLPRKVKGYINWIN